VPNVANQAICSHLKRYWREDALLQLLLNSIHAALRQLHALAPGSGVDGVEQRWLAAAQGNPVAGSNTVSMSEFLGVLRGHVRVSLQKRTVMSFLMLWCIRLWFITDHR